MITVNGKSSFVGIVFGCVLLMGFGAIIFL
jgi:hypothetical protein